MREKLETLPVAELRELAKAQGLKGVSSMRKAELIELLCQQAEKNPQVKPAQAERAAEASPASAGADRENARASRGITDPMTRTARTAGTGITTTARARPSRQRPPTARLQVRSASSAPI